MGFHKKTDFPDRPHARLDKSYRLLIKPSVDECGLTCVRADEITHSGVIDVPMYQQLLDSDLVIADLSTSNPNALYELGVRHALRPFSTIVIAESKLQYPFDIAHTAIRSYQHLGDAIDYEEVIRFRAELKSAITTILERAGKGQSGLHLPAGLAAARRHDRPGGGRGSVKRGAPPAAEAPQSAAVLIDRANEAMEQKDFVFGAPAAVDRARHAASGSSLDGERRLRRAAAGARGGDECDAGSGDVLSPRRSQLHAGR